MLKSLLKSVRQYKTASLLTPILVAAEVVLECLLPFIMAELIDEMTGTSMTPIIKYGSVLIIMAILSLIFWGIVREDGGDSFLWVCKELKTGYVF